MAVKPAHPQTSEALHRPFQTHLRTLPLRHVIASDLAPEKPAAWLRAAAAAGWPLPLGLACDLGLLLSQSSKRLTLAKPDYLPFDEDTAAYLAFLERLATHPLVRQLPHWQPPLSDAVLAVILARLVEGLDMPDSYCLPTGAEGARFTRVLSGALIKTDLAQLWRDTPIDKRPRWSELLPPAALAHIEAKLRTLDAGELRFLVRFGPPLAGAPDPRDLLDLLALTGLPPVARLALTQTIRLLPRVSNSHTVGGIQTYPEGGYEGLARKGSLDSLLPTELAYPQPVFLHRVLNHEALYYGRERPPIHQRALAYLVVQTGAGLGGDGETLARALLLALGQTLQRRSYHVLYSFAGAELSEPRPLEKPGEVGQVLYYRDNARVNEQRVLHGVLRHLRRWRESYRSRQVLWLLSEYFDADQPAEHQTLYNALHAEAGQQAWCVRVGNGGQTGKPAAAAGFRRWQVVTTDLLWQGQPPPYIQQPKISLKPPPEGPRIIPGSPEMIELPAGTFLMGSPDSDDQAIDREKPQHAVTVSGFQMARFPVTRALYRETLGQAPSQWEGEEEDLLPANYVSWFDAVAFCNALSERQGLQLCYRIEGEQVEWDRGADGYRLPTEAEWEYAVRAGTKTRWFFGDEVAELGQYAWFSENAGSRVHPVGEKESNPWGLHDLIGNVYEWCWDWFEEDYYSTDRASDPIGPPKGVVRVLRGGAFHGPAQFLRSAFRFWYEPEFRFSDLGFRCARGPRRQP